VKTGTPLTPALGKLYTNFDFCNFVGFCFRVTSPYGTDWRTDGRARRV